MKTKEVISYLEGLFAELHGEDSSHNGLQIAARDEIDKVAFSVDACYATFEKAAAEGADLLVVHHGLFWRSVELVVEQHYRRLKFMLENGIGLYAMHLPLDAHPELGNNARLAQIAGASSMASFADYQGYRIGKIASFKRPVSREKMLNILDDQLDTHCKLLPFGPEQISRMGIVSGSGADHLSEAIECGCDTFLTGEPEHVMFHLALERGVNVLMAGHYATETVGLKALQTKLEKDLGLKTTFIDYPTGL